MDISNDKIFLFLQDLRQKIIKIFIFVLAASFLCYFFKKNIWYLIQYPYLKIKPESSLIFITPFEALYINLEISILGGVFLALPFIFYQVISLLPVEKIVAGRRMIFVSILAFLLFITGVIFCYSIVIPSALRFFLQFENEFLSAQWSAARYISFLLWTLFFFGLIFEMPLILYFLTKLNIVQAHVLRKNRKYAILLIFIAAGFLTPGPDPMSQILLAVPMVIFYEIGIRISALHKY
ncbi:MAG: twin-arginine translocase subunit TatC [bacterium]|nr:twin-arginine translocase subunit TatC [bacterium]